MYKSKLFAKLGLIIDNENIGNMKTRALKLVKNSNGNTGLLLTLNFLKILFKLKNRAVIKP